MSDTNKYALAALKDKRATLAGEILSLKRQLAWRQDQIVHVDAAIQLFDPSYKVGSIPAKRKRVKLFRQGELGRMIVDALRRAGKPLATQDIVSAVMAATGSGEQARAAIKPRVRGNLAYLGSRGSVMKLGRGAAVRWVLSSQP